jgi:hypothetical protein
MLIPRFRTHTTAPQPVNLTHLELTKSKEFLKVVEGG